MIPLRIALALALASLAAPALAEKCSVCDFSDEPIVVKPKHSAGAAGSGQGQGKIAFNEPSLKAQPQRPGGLAAAERKPAPALNSVEWVFVNPTGAASNPLAAPVRTGSGRAESISFTHQKMERGSPAPPQIAPGTPALRR
jgi:hypothetical protein